MAVGAKTNARDPFHSDPFLSHFKFILLSPGATKFGHDAAKVMALFYWSPTVCERLKRSNYMPSIGQQWEERKPHMLALLIECVLDVALSDKHRVSESPGFECFMGVHCYADE